MKKEKKKIVLGVVIAIIILIIVAFVVILSTNARNKTENEQNENWENPYTEIDKNEIQYQESASIDELKNETGLTADSNLYEVNTEYDGRKVLSIKANIQYKVAFAGIIKGQAPKIDEVDTILQENHPTENGVWIDKQSRSKFLELIKGNTKSEYEINEKGYLTIKNKNEQNENDKSLEKFINSGKHLVITISNMYYEVDSVTGEVVEYPFEQLDAYQTYSQVMSDDNIIFVITSNKNKKLTNQEILEDLLQNGLQL